MTNNLPPGWTSSVSKTHQKEYFHHAATGSSVWSRQEMEAKERELKQVKFLSAKEAVGKEISARRNENVREMVRARLTSLIENPESIKVEFNVFGDDFTYVVHEVANEMGLTTAMEDGEDGLRVVAYKEGCFPDNDDDAVNADNNNNDNNNSNDVAAAADEADKNGEDITQQQQYAANTTKKQQKRRRGVANPPPPLPVEGVQTLGTEKRDRRTIEEIELEKRRKKAS